MKKLSILFVICVLVGMLISACGSSRPCPAYKSVVPVTSSVEAPADCDQSS